MNTAIVGLLFTFVGALATLGFGFLFTYCAVSMPMFSSKSFFSIPDREKQLSADRYSYIARFRFSLRFFSYHKIRITNALAFCYSAEYKQWICLTDMTREHLAQRGYAKMTPSEFHESKDGQEVFGVDFDKFYDMPKPLYKEGFVRRSNSDFAPCFVILEVNTVAMLLFIALPEYNGNDYAENSPVFVGQPIVYSSLSSEIIEDAKEHASSRFAHLDQQFEVRRRSVVIRRMR